MVFALPNGQVVDIPDEEIGSFIDYMGIEIIDIEYEEVESKLLCET